MYKIDINVFLFMSHTDLTAHCCIYCSWQIIASRLYRGSNQRAPTGVPTRLGKFSLESVGPTFLYNLLLIITVTAASSHAPAT